MDKMSRELMVNRSISFAGPEASASSTAETIFTRPGFLARIFAFEAESSTSYMELPGSSDLPDRMPGRDLNRSVESWPREPKRVSARSRDLLDRLTVSEPEIPDFEPETFVGIPAGPVGGDPSMPRRHWRESMLFTLVKFIPRIH
ncbi:MAG: hypothetical protein IH611_08410 [Deltaproteobacteria bacterium]|nr:hypothetical protein [Deltaproteobacteria bacterium]